MGTLRAFYALAPIVAGLLCGCQSDRSVEPPRRAPAASNTALVRPAAYVNSEPIGREALWQASMEAVGGVVLEEAILDAVLAERLKAGGLTIDAAAIDAERRLLLASLADDEQQAGRLLAELRERRGLGPLRFEQLLRRNAALRALVRDEVVVGDAAVREAFEAQYGPRYEARLITVDTLAAASEIVRRARAGESFIDLAIARSTDPSRAQGGLLEPISPADATYPQAIRTVLAQLQPGEVSEPIALERGLAVLKLERRLERSPVEYERVKEELTQRVRRQLERLRMQQLARGILAEADVVVLDPTLKAQWDQSVRRVAAEP